MNSVLNIIKESLISISFNEQEVSEVLKLIESINSRKASMEFNEDLKTEELDDQSIFSSIENKLQEFSHYDTYENNKGNNPSNENSQIEENIDENTVNDEIQNPYSLSSSPQLFDEIDKLKENKNEAIKTNTNKIIVYVNKRRLTLTKDINNQWTISPIVKETNSTGSNQFIHQRIEILARIISSETDYISKLFSICKTYKERLSVGNLNFEKKKIKSSKSLKPLSVLNLFANIEQIWKLHNTIVKEIFILKKKPQYCLVGTLFWNLIPNLRIYSYYLNNWRNARIEVSELKKNTWFTEFLENGKENCNHCPGIPFDILLTFPLNRITQYQIELEELKKVTESSDPDYQYLEKAIFELGELKEQTGESRSMSEIEKLSTEITGLTEKLAVPGRILLQRGLLHELKGKKKIPTYWWLFNDILISAEPNKSVPNKYSFRKKYYVEKLQIEEFENEVSFDLIHDEEKMKMDAEVENSRTRWILSLKSSINNVFKTKYFGVSLDVLMKKKENDGLEIIELVTTLVENIKQFGLDISRIMIKENENNESNFVIESINRGAMIHVTDYATDTVGEVLKNFIRSLPDPVVSYDLFHPITLVIKSQDSVSAKSKKINEILRKLQGYRYDLLIYLFDFFSLLLLHKEKNKIDSNSLAISLGCGILCPEPRTKENHMGRNFDYESIYGGVQFLMENFVEVFERNISPPIKVSSTDLLTRQVVANFKTPVPFTFDSKSFLERLPPDHLQSPLNPKGENYNTENPVYKCNECNKPLMNDEICATTSKYLFHVDCMKCTLCPRNLKYGYMEQNALILCVADYSKLYGVRCLICFSPIEGETIESKSGDNYHAACCVCSKCGISLESEMEKENYSLVNGILFCNTCTLIKPSIDKKLQKNTPTEKSNPLLDLLLQRDCCFLREISDAVGAGSDELANNLLRLFDLHGKTIDLVKFFVKKEVAKSSSSGTLFRGNTLATKLMKNFTNFVGIPFLFASLKDPMSLILKTDQVIELDPRKATLDEKTIQENQHIIDMLTNQFLTFIFNSIDSVPFTIRQICETLYINVITKYNKSGSSAVGGYIFLRFICPAIVAPHTFGLLPQGTTLAPNQSRILMLISKIIQNLSNGVFFEEKEVYLQFANESILKKRKQDFDKFIQQISVVDYSNISASNQLFFNQPYKPPNLLEKIKEELSVRIPNFKENLNGPNDQNLLKSILSVLEKKK